MLVQKSFAATALVMSSVCMGWGTNAHAASLYDPGLGTLPTAQGWFNTTSTSYETLASGGLLQQNTSADVSLTGGSARFAPSVLNTATGFSLSFNLQVLSESHVTTNRAGFSVIAVGNDPAHAIELAFWNDRVWAYAYDASAPDHFVHGTEALFNTTSTSHTFELQVLNQQFALQADGHTLFTGALANYTAQGAPYNVSNFLFFGDNTSRASANVLLGAVSLGAAPTSISPVPEPAGVALMLAGLGIVAGAVRRSRCHHGVIPD